MRSGVNVTYTHSTEEMVELLSSLREFRHVKNWQPLLADCHTIDLYDGPRMETFFNPTKTVEHVMSATGTSCTVCDRVGTPERTRTYFDRLHSSEWESARIWVPISPVCKECLDSLSQSFNGKSRRFLSFVLNIVPGISWDYREELELTIALQCLVELFVERSGLSQAQRRAWRWEYGV
jgi:hypothetical protein